MTHSLPISDLPQPPDRAAAVERARAELNAGCLECGCAWKLHFSRGEYRGCK